MQLESLNERQVELTMEMVITLITRITLITIPEDPNANNPNDPSDPNDSTALPLGGMCG